jgi:hypothetical protein
MRTYILHICLFLSLFSCKDKNEKVELPDTILKQDKIVATLVDIHLAEAKLNVSRNASKSPLETDTISFSEVFVKNGITKAAFDSTMVFYTKHPKLMDETYDKVIEIISSRKEKAEKK